MPLPRGPTRTPSGVSGNHRYVANFPAFYREVIKRLFILSYVRLQHIGRLITKAATQGEEKVSFILNICTKHF